MRGYKDFNFPAFFAAAEALREEGHTVFNPAERDVKEWGAEVLKTETGNEEEISQRLGFTDRLALARNCFAADTEWICNKADAVYALPGWEKSKGAIAEIALAEAIGLIVMEIIDAPEAGTEATG